MKILFVSNQLQRNGAPLRMLEIIKYVKEKSPSCVIDVVAGRAEDSIIDQGIINEIFLFSKYRVHQKIQVDKTRRKTWTCKNFNHL